MKYIHSSYVLRYFARNVCTDTCLLICPNIPIAWQCTPQLSKIFKCVKPFYSRKLYEAPCCWFVTLLKHFHFFNANTPSIKLQNERDELAGQFEAEQSWVVEQLLVKIRKLEAEISANHKALEQLRREKVDLENALEHEQESLFNTLGKRMDQLEAEKR